MVQKNFFTKTALLLLLMIVISCSPARVLNLKSKSSFSEKNTFSIKVGTELRQVVIYNDPQSADDAYQQTLTIIVSDTSRFKQLKTITVEKDNSIVKCHYDLASAWNSGEEKQNITGGLVLVKWSLNEITVKMDLVVEDLTFGKNRIYKGTRTFIKSN